ncbi:hypothetical protein [Niabella sp.]|uniref:hypothetical protein n=1 Tax=Niabella sp. TaxID=1962976 RepID=UPI002623ED7D|nr:hypothetical protein [Niabella sp.]
MKIRTKHMRSWLYTAVVALLVVAAGCKKGDVGSSGPAGPAGATGVQGVQGIPGTNGSKFYSGAGIPDAALGTLTDMYLDMGSSKLYGPKTAAGWGTPVDLKGYTGAVGATGATGSNGATGNTGATGNIGATGSTGATGNTGATGSTGIPGAVGATGVTGATGKTGATGNTGATGVAGSRILSGNGAPASDLGALGDYYLDNLTAFLYGPKTGNGWGIAPISLKGPKGDAGGGTTVMAKSMGITNVQWVWSTTFWFSTSQAGATGKTTRYVDIAEPLITQELIDHGAIQLYFSNYIMTTPYRCTSLPFTMQSFNEKYTYNICYEYFVGGIRLHYFFAGLPGYVPADLPDLSKYIIPTYTFKYVLIPGTQIAYHKNIDLKNYDAVKAAYRITD